MTEDVSVEVVALSLWRSPDVAKIAQALLSERRKGREEGLEEAAVLMEEHCRKQPWAGRDHSHAIRALKDKQP